MSIQPVRFIAMFRHIDEILHHHYTLGKAGKMPNAADESVAISIKFLLILDKYKAAKAAV